jgi:hypothetical protein
VSAEIVNLRRVQIEIDISDIGVELLAETAFEQVKRYANELEDACKAAGGPMLGRALVRLRPSAKLLTALRDPDAFDLDVEMTLRTGGG